MLLHEFRTLDFKIQVQDSLSDPTLIKKWKDMTLSARHLRPEMLFLLEKSKPLDLKFRYLYITSLSNNEELCGVVYLQQLKFNHRNFYFAKKNILHYFALLTLRFSSFKVLLAGCLFSVDFSPLAFNRNKITPEDILKILDEYSKQEKYDIMVLKDMPDIFHKTMMHENGFDPFETDLTMQLEINPRWKSLQDYEKALTHKYAQRVRKITKQGSSLQRREISFDEFNTHRSRIKELFHQVSEKQTVRMGIVDDIYFEELFKALGEDFKMTCYFLNEKMIAFSSHIFYPEKLEVHYIGIDYEYNSKYALYFNILYDGITMAIEHSRKSLELGRTAREAKAVVGCHPIYFNDYLKVRSPLTKWLLDLLRNYFNKGIGEGWKKRHPFKTIASDITVK
ncbi:MAG: GNAT family N-acetyltransferase [Bacteroidia bacterium]|nr:GNAT family N-acetyltransferase [Bacteroidia bacterium]